MDQNWLKFHKFYYDLSDSSSALETFSTNLKPIGRNLSPDKTYQKYRELLKEGYLLRQSAPLKISD